MHKGGSFSANMREIAYLEMREMCRHYVAITPQFSSLFSGVIARLVAKLLYRLHAW